MNLRILHFAQHHDIQTAAMLCCAFGRHCPPYELSRSSSLSSKSIVHSVSFFFMINNIYDLFKL